MFKTRTNFQYCLNNTKTITKINVVSITAMTELL